MESKTRKMKALSIQQPWAWAILHLGKNIENRKWAWPKTIPLPCRLVIHAGKQIDQEGLELLRQWGYTIPDDIPMGCLLGEVDVTGCVSAPIGILGNQWAFGPYCWKLANPVAYAEPIPCLGKLGIFDVLIPESEATR